MDRQAAPRGERSNAGRVSVTATVTRERTIRALAAAHKGLVRRGELLALGLGEAAIDGRLRRGELKRVHRGVYLLGVSMPDGAAELAALYAFDPPTFVSHASATHLMRLGPPPETVEVTVVGRKLESRRGITVHRTASLGDDEHLVLDGIAVTAPARTILDLATRLSTDALERLLAEAAARNPDVPRQLEILLRRYPGRSGTRRLRRLLDHPGGQSFSHEGGERLLRDLLRRAELPQPRRNARLLGFEVDFYFERHRLVLEFDSHAFHAARPKRERDSLRDQKLMLAGEAVMRITWEQLTRRPEALLARIAMALGRREVELRLLGAETG